MDEYVYFVQRFVTQATLCTSRREFKLSCIWFGVPSCGLSLSPGPCSFLETSEQLSLAANAKTACRRSSYCMLILHHSTVVVGQKLISRAILSSSSHVVFQAYRYRSGIVAVVPSVVDERRREDCCVL